MLTGKLEAQIKVRCVVDWANSNAVEINVSEEIFSFPASEVLERNAWPKR